MSNIAVGVESDCGGKMLQVLIDSEGRPAERRAFVWADMMRKLATTTLSFRFFAVGDLDDRDAAEYVRREYGWAPW